jgi:hypothetical protein
VATRARDTADVVEDVNVALGSKLDTSAYTAPGLVLITAETITAQSDISVNGCFTSAYRNYQIVYELVASTTANPALRLRASGSDATAAQYDLQVFGGDSSSAAAAALIAQTSFSIAGGGSRLYSFGTLTVLRPALAVPTFFLNNATQSNADGAFSATSQIAGSHRASVAYDGFTFTFATATGTLRVYGLKD